MAPVGESFYFPPLDKCLSREHCLISWKTAYIGLTQVKTTEPSVTLQRFLSDAYTVELLSRPFEPFKKPTSQTKSSFETKTAAINVTPSIHGQYDINQVKDDALWLSKETEIDELSALRIVVQEWQTRSTAHLLNGFSAEEAASLQDVAGANGFGTSFLGLQSSIPPAVTAGHDTFALSINQQLRLIDLYLAERRYILKVCECLVYACFQEKALVTKSRGKGRDTGKEKDRSSWVAELGGSILEEDSPVGGASQRRRSLCLGCIHALQPRIDGLQQGSGYFKAEGGQDNIEEAWGKNQILEMIHIMQLIFLLVDSSTEITASSVIVAWFRFTGRYSFFDNFALVGKSPRAVVTSADVIVQAV
ncbi:MAG: hypothetical protein M1830_010275 [Pleopsidium flavum]|nr:MAG: hypothetical protein M1830_010275 [Pleopsidium flavum]